MNNVNFSELTDAQLAVVLEAIRRTIKQGKPAFSTVVGDCVYRTPEGLRCAVGSIIENKLCTPAIEKRSINVGVVQRAVFASFPGVDLDNPAFISIMATVQTAHDQVATADDDETDFREAFVTRLSATFPSVVMSIIRGYVDFYKSKD